MKGHSSLSKSYIMIIYTKIPVSEEIKLIDLLII